MTPQIVRSPFDNNFSSAYGTGSPYGSPSYGTEEEFSPYWGGNGGNSSGDYFSYGHAPGDYYPNQTNASDSSNIDNIDDLLSGLSLNNTGWTNLNALASVCALNVNAAPDPYSLLAQSYCENLRKHRDLVQQLDSVLSSIIQGGGSVPSRPNLPTPGSPYASPSQSPRSRHSPNGASGYYPNGGAYQTTHYGGSGYYGAQAGGVQSALDIAARHHRSSANSQVPQKVWEGDLPLRTNFTGETLSNKIFLGGVPWDTPEYLLITVFSQFGPVKVEWPQATPDSPSGPKGFAYLVYETSAAAQAMLEHCAFDGNSYYYKIPSKKRGRESHNSMVRNFKDVEVVPWATSDSNYSPQSPASKLEPGKTIFVGALHGRLTAAALFTVMNDLFGDVVYAGIDTDKHKYPIGSGRITFGSSRAYSDAIRAAFIEVKSARICKKLQLDPYLEDNVCSECQTHSGPYFCREGICYRYFCRSCWLKVHIGEYARHEPIVRNVRKSPPTTPPTVGSLGAGSHSPPSVTGTASNHSLGSLLERSSLV